jgi:TonB family protein
MPEKTFSYFKNSVWLLLALLAHLIFFTGMALQFHFTPVDFEVNRALPAYMYHDDKPPRPTPNTMPETTENEPPPQPQEEASAASDPTKGETSVNGILSAQKPSTTEQSKTEGQTRSFHYKVPTGSINFKAEKQVDRPLLRILSIATSAKLFYPKIAEDFRISGTCKIRFRITPEGEVSDVSVVESSGAGVLDSAGLETIKAISPVEGVGPYLKEPQYLVVALIYD